MVTGPFRLTVTSDSEFLGQNPLMATRALLRDQPVIHTGAPTQLAGPTSLTPWKLLGWVGLLFSIVAGIDLLLTWYPFRMGSPEWEFGTITSFISSMPVFTMGVTLILASMVAQGHRNRARLLGSACLIFCVLMLALTAIYATNIPIALGAVSDPLIRLGLKKAIFRTLAAGVLYAIGFAVIGAIGWKQFSRR